MFGKSSLHCDTFRLMLTDMDFFVLTLSPAAYQTIQEQSDKESDSP